MSLAEGADIPAKRYGMVVDVNRCVGCQTCTIACKHANDTMPGVQWRSVIDVEQGDYPNVERFFLVTGCQHCAEPPCVPVCPSGATYQRDDGLVVMDYDLCIGCGYCAVACPYDARTLAHEMKFYYGEATLQEKHVAHKDRIGVAQKCTFCVDRVDEAHERGLTPGVHLDVTPACAGSCIAQAIKFGDFADPNSEVSRLVAERASFQINDFLNTDPQIKYLYEVPNSIPGAPAAELTDDDLRDPNNPLNGKLQPFWDFRAAMNFTMGGMGSGLIAMVALSAALGLAPVDLAVFAVPVAGVTVAIGLFFVFLEIGRKWRALNVMLRPNTSWMTREVYVVIVLYPLLALVWFRPSVAAMLALSAAGTAFLFCQARIIHAAKGIPAWRTPLIPVLICVSGLSEGGGLALLIALYVGAQIPAVLATIVAAASVAMLTLWLVYVATARKAGIPPLAVDVLKAITPFYVGVMAAALMALGYGFAMPVSAAIGVAAVGFVLCGAIWKFAIITRAAHQQGFVLPNMPQRGAGNRAAPHRQGWHTRAG